MFATKSKLSYLEKIGKENTRFYIEQTAFDISSAYYQLLNEITLRNFLIEAQEYSRARLELIKLKLQVGNSNNFELQNAQFDFNSDSISIVQQNLKVKQLYLQINRIINQFDDFEFNPTDKIEISTSVDREFIQNQALKNNIQINIEKIKQLVNSQEVEILKGNFYPDLSALANYSFQDQQNTVSIYKSNRSYGLNYGIRFSFNLYNGEQDAINVQNAKIDLENSSIQIKDKELELKNLVAKSYNIYKSLLEILELQKQNSELAANSVEIAKKQLEVGSINSFDFRQIQLNYLSSNIKKFDTEYQVKIQEIELLDWEEFYSLQLCGKI